MQSEDTLPSRVTPLDTPVGTDFPLIVTGALLLVALVIFAETFPASRLTAWLQVVRIPLGLVYVLYVPGYCLTAALFPDKQTTSAAAAALFPDKQTTSGAAAALFPDKSPKKAQPPARKAYRPLDADEDGEPSDGKGALDGIERAGLSLGLSVAWVPVLALVLDRLPWGLRLWPILTGELISILVFSTVALWRRSRLSPETAYVPQLWQPKNWWRTLSTYERRIYLLCAAALTFAGIATAWVFLVPSPAEFMTEFYILGPERLAENYPREMTAGEPASVIVEVHSIERETHDYRIEVWAVDPWEADRRERVLQTGAFTLAPDQTATNDVSWTMPWAGDDQQVEFLLFIDDDPEPYRRLRLWLNVLEP